MSKVIEKTTEKLPKYMRRLTGGTYEARKMINGRTIRVSGKNLTEVMLEFEFKIKCMDNPYLEGARITLDEWFDTWFKTYKEPNIYCFKTCCAVWAGLQAVLPAHRRCE